MQLLVCACLLLAAFCVPAGAADEAPGNGPWESQRGLFRLHVNSDIEPLRINRIHGWQLLLETADGQPVRGAVISASGGMPEHNHGLPTAPRVIEGAEPGDYRIEGLRFHMRGAWQIRLEIEALGKTDTVLLDLQL